jgi:hypothetical protein
MTTLALEHTVHRALWVNINRLKERMLKRELVRLAGSFGAKESCIQRSLLTTEVASVEPGSAWKTWGKSRRAIAFLIAA